jgi:hypothetical protein
MPATTAIAAPADRVRACLLLSFIVIFCMAAPIP